MIDEAADNDALPNRKSLRLKGWDYHTPGWYFVTICAKEMASFFGTVVKGRMVLNDAGRMVRQVWDDNLYIRFNPKNYDAVFQCGEPRFLGNKELLALPKVGFLASRGGILEHGSLPLSKDEAIISGFLSPMERKVFWSGLKHKKPLIWVKPWSLEEGTDAPAIRSALEEGRLLILSPFAEQEAPSVRRAAWCNEYVLAHCDRLVIGCLNPEGMLACILSEARMDLEIVRLDAAG